MHGTRGMCFPMFNSGPPRPQAITSPVPHPPRRSFFGSLQGIIFQQLGIAAPVVTHSNSLLSPSPFDLVQEEVNQWADHTGQVEREPAQRRKSDGYPPITTGG